MKIITRNCIIILAVCFLFLSGNVSAADLTPQNDFDSVMSLPVHALRRSANNLWIDYCNGAAQHETRVVQLDCRSAEVFELSGWCADLLAGTPLSQLYVRVDNVVFPCVYGTERAEVAEFYQEPALKNVGFQVSIPAAAFRNGEVNALAFVAVSQDGTYRYEDAFYEIRYISPEAAPDENAAQNHDGENAVQRTLWMFLVFAFVLVSVIAFAVYLTGVRGAKTLKRFSDSRFLFSQLIKRDFTLKYKRTVLGMAWSILSPLLNLLIMWLVFNRLLGSNIDHFVIYLFAGQLVMNYFTDATTLGMTSLLENAEIFSKVNVPKYLFLFSRNMSSMINFGLTLLIFFVFVILEGIPFTFKFFMLLYPIVCLILLNIGIGMILSALYMFFRDMRYLWGVATQLIMWVSAVFYSIEGFDKPIQNLFLLNPVYLCIRYFRKIVLDNSIPSPQFHLLMAFYSLALFGIGCIIYKKKNHEFLYYI